MKPEEINKILDEVQGVFHTLLSEKPDELKQPAIERWRWDEPGITLTWIGPDHIGRNIHASVAAPNDYRPRLEIQVNAWKDEDQGPEGMTSGRRWRHDPVDIIDIPFEMGPLRKVVKEGYSKVAAWNVKFLNKQAVLAPSPTR